MPRSWVILDAPGYKRAAEEGFCWHPTGAQLAAKWVPANPFNRPNQIQIETNFHNPPGTDWLICRPRQMNPEWYRDSRLGQHLLALASWTFAAGLSPLEWLPSRTAAGSIAPDDKWLSLTVPAGTVSLDARNYVAMAQAASLPSGLFNDFVTVARADTAPNGLHLAAEGGELSPYWQWLTQPQPQHVAVFGWGATACILYNEQAHILKCVDNDVNKWELKGSFKFTTPQPPRSAYDPTRRGNPFQPDFSQQTNLRIQPRSVLALSIASVFCQLYFSDGGSFTLPLQLRKAQQGLFGAGPWWVAGRPGQHLQWQAQVVGFEVATTGPLEPPGLRPTLFDLSDNYQPTEEPRLSLDALLWEAPGASPLLVSTPGFYQSTSLTYPGMSVAAELRDENNALWASDGTHHAGFVHCTMTPSDGGAVPAGYLTPFLRALQLRFPSKLVDRICDPLVLSDREFRGYEASTSLRDPDGKRIEIDFWQLGVQAFVEAGLQERLEYPVEIWEGDEGPETLRVAGWVTDSALEERLLENDDRSLIAYYRLTGRGLIHQAKEPWLYLPTVIDPNNEHVSHSFAVQHALAAGGIDVEDPQRFVAFLDPWAGTDIEWLPGSERQQAGHGHKDTGSYEPTWQEEKLAYAHRVATEWRGWVLYEDLAGVIHYHPDLILWLLNSRGYDVSATVYLSSNAARAAGYPGQYVEASSSVSVAHAGNTVRCTGKEQDGSRFPQVIETDPRSITDPEYENYLGRPKVILPTMISRFAVEEAAARIIAHVYLQSRGRKIVTYQLAPLLAPPWELKPAPVDVGFVVAYPDRGDLLAEHVTVRYLQGPRDAQPALYKTELTGVRLPAGSRLEPRTGDWLFPGASG